MDSSATNRRGIDAAETTSFIPRCSLLPIRVALSKRAVNGECALVNLYERRAGGCLFERKQCSTS